ncbi:hypothetical protein EMCRGX_G000418 [Ephydatia muelleri]|eukprot:Em0001g305a
MVSEVDSCKWSIDKLDSSNWMTWKFQMKHLLLSKGLWGIVDGSERLAEDASVQQQAEFRKRAQTAFSTLVLSISSSQLYLITSCEEPAPAWVALRNHFERDTLVNKLMLKKQYFRMEMKEGSSIEAHIKAMKELTDKLAAIKAPISEEDQVVTLLGSLPSSYSTLVTALEARDAVSLSYVQQALIQEEQRMNEVDSKSDAGQSAVFDEKTGRAFVGKQSQQCQKGRQQKVCYLCGETGHIRWNCPENHQERSLSKPKHIAKPVKTMEEDSELACGASSKSYNKENWIVDSGASSHMTQTQEFMVNYEEFGTPQKVCLGDGRTLEAFGKGKVIVTMVFKRCEREKVTMYDVLYVPKLACNLFSVRAAAAKGNTVKFDDSGCCIWDRRGNLLGTGSLVEKLYYLDCETTISQEKVSIASGFPVNNKINLWHQRLGHLNEHQLKEMASQDLVKGLCIPCNTRMSFCEKCVEGKMARKPFQSVGEIRTTRKLQLVHSDVCGPMPTESIGGSRYFVTFVDDYSRFCRVYFMKRKSEAFDKFKEFERCSTNECGLSIGIFRSDNGGEYISKEFEKFLLDKGIHHELSAPYSPAQNGVAERINRTLMESARTMMAQAGLSDKYWAEAVVTGTYLRNRVPTRSFKEKTTPFEKWYEKKPDLSHLRVFGCMAYAYIPDANRKDKLSKKAEKLRFIGYSLQTKAYRLINDDTGKIIVRRDVIFNESDFQYDSTTGTVGAEGITFKRDEVVIQEIPKEVEWPEQVQEVELEQEQQEQEDAEQSRYPRRMRIAPTRNHKASQRHWRVIYQSNGEKQQIQSISRLCMQNETWECVELPKGRKPVGCKWVFKAKRGSDGKVQRFKARLVAKGFTQKHGIDYDETFSPVVRFTSVRTLLAFAVQNGMMVHQIDVVTAFLNGTLEEEIYMEQPPGYIKKGEEHLVCKLKKSIYGLKQSPRCWNMVFNEYMTSLSYEQCAAHPCVLVRTEGTETTIIAVYVDDLIIIAKNPETMERIKGSLTERFKMKDLGKLHYCLGINIEYDENKRCLWMHQRPYIQSLLERYQLSEAKSSCTPADINVKLVKDDGAAKLADSVCYQSMVGSLLYAAIATRPDIAQAVGAVSKFNSCPTETHLTGVKRILRYLKGTINLGLKFEKTADSSIIGFSDADWAGDLDNRHSTSGNLFVMSGGAISWLSKKQPVVALSTTEAEYVALGAATQEVVWLRRLLSDIKASPKMPTIISEDNQGTIAIARNPVYHARTKHIDIKYHYVREALMDGVIDLVYCPTQQMTADILTKPLSRDQFETFRHEMGLKDIPQ